MDDFSKFFNSSYSKTLLPGPQNQIVYHKKTTKVKTNVVEL